MGHLVLAVVQELEVLLEVAVLQVVQDLLEHQVLADRLVRQAQVVVLGLAGLQDRVAVQELEVRLDRQEHLVLVELLEVRVAQVQAVLKEIPQD